MWQDIPKNRLFLYMLLAGLLPAFFVSVYLISQQSEISDLRDRIAEIQHTVNIKEKKQAINRAVRAHYKDADHFYIDKHLETLTFLESESESLKKFIEKSFFDSDQAKKRLEFLLSKENSLSFTEGIVESTPYFQETLETMVHPIEVNSQDLQQLLSKIEGIPIGSYTASPNRPHLLILDFKLNRKTVNDKSEVFLLNMKLLKREYL